jgi:hypothetical protein
MRSGVRVSLVCFGAPGGVTTKWLDGQSIDSISADLMGAGAAGDLTLAVKLSENSNASFVGGMKKGSFDIEGNVARSWLQPAGNPNGRPNSDVLFPWINGLDVTRRPCDMWIVDFGVNSPLPEATLYETPFGHVVLQRQTST